MRTRHWKNSENENLGMLELIYNVYGDAEIKNPNYIRWQYNENPQGKAIVVLCFDEEKEDFIIGQETIIPTELNIGNTIVKTSISVNSIVHSEYRRRGIFSELLSLLPDIALKEDIGSVYTAPNSISHNAFLKEGWKEIARLPLLVRILKPSNYFNNVLKIFLRPIDFFYKIYSKDLLKIEEYNGDFNDFKHLTTKLPNRIKISLNRNQQYLQWRYNNHPTRKYTTHVVRKESELIAYIITRETKFDGKPIGVILDFVTNGEKNNEEEFVNLVKFALFELQKKRIAVAIATFSPPMLEYKILKKAGFFKVPEFLKPEPLPFIVNIFDKNNDELKSIENYDNWFFTFGDYDIF